MFEQARRQYSQGFQLLGIAWRCEAQEPTSEIQARL